MGLFCIPNHPQTITKFTKFAVFGNHPVTTGVRDPSTQIAIQAFKMTCIMCTKGCTNNLQ